VQWPPPDPDVPRGNSVKRIAWLGAFLVLGFAATSVQAGEHCSRYELDRVNRRLCGRIIDHTHNHGADRRIWSAALHERRDLYVYLPPGFDPCRQYPLVLWLHGFMQDEKSFLNQKAEWFDHAIACGQLPPMIIAAPDGSLKGTANIFAAGSFFINSKAGNFEDYIMCDVWNFVVTHYPIRPEREAHAIGGMSMGGFAAFNLSIKHPDVFKVVIGVFPPLNLRWVDCHCRYMSDFDPCCWGWRTQMDNGWEVVGRFYGVITIRLRHIVDPLFGRGPKALAAVARENPIEMIDTYGLQEGVLDMYVAYVKRDEFNIDAQVESFLYRAHQRGLTVSVGYDPNGRHNTNSAGKLFPGIARWLGPRLAPYSPAPLNDGTCLHP
jgi:pimeloyl-ACP methyl ester carboxylesterase